MKYIFVLLICFFGLWGCNSDVEISGNYYNSKNEVITFGPGKKFTFGGKKPVTLPYEKKGNTIKVIGGEFVVPLEFTVLEDGSLRFVNEIYTKK